MLLSAVHALCLELGMEKHYWVAYSGGLDSHVLLHLCAQLRAQQGIRVTAIHINHGLSPNAKQWATHCENVCRDLAIDFISHHVIVHARQGNSLEELARELRYQTISQYLQPGDVLLTAHHQQDQAETLLLQLLRGAGAKGLAAMPSVKSFKQGLHARPLLLFPRESLLAVAEAQQLQWIEDESNQQTLFARNYLRHHVLPLMKERWPAAVTTLTRSAQHCAESEVLLAELALEKLRDVMGSRSDTLSVAKLMALSQPQQRWLLRGWIQQGGFRVPGMKKLLTIQQCVLTAAWDRVPEVKWANCVMRRYRDDLFLLPSMPELTPGLSFEWSPEEKLLLPGVGVLQAMKKIGEGLRGGHLTVRFRQGGEWLTLPGRGRHSLKNLMQDWGIVPWERASIPLLYDGNELIAVVGYAIHPDWLVGEKEEGWLVWVGPFPLAGEGVNLY